MDETLKTLIMANPEIDFEIKFQSEKSSFELKTEEIKKYLNGVPIDNFEVIDWIAGKIRDGLKVVFGGVLNEISG